MIQLLSRLDLMPSPCATKSTLVVILMVRHAIISRARDDHDRHLSIVLANDGCTYVIINPCMLYLCSVRARYYTNRFLLIEDVLTCSQL